MSPDHASPEHGVSGSAADVVGCLHEIESVLDGKVLDYSVQYIERQDGKWIVLHFVGEIGLRLEEE